MKIVCCVCKKLIQIKDTGNPKEDDLISHSYCQECYKRETEEMLKAIKEATMKFKVKELKGKSVEEIEAIFNRKLEESKMLKHFTKTKRLIRCAEFCGIERRWFESNRSLENRIKKAIIGGVQK